VGAGKPRLVVSRFGKSSIVAATRIVVTAKIRRARHLYLKCVLGDPAN
jgi:hypothetical protein